MPEGDTIHGAAARLRAALLGHPLTAIELSRVAGPVPAVGVVVTRIEARGKHLLIWLSDGLVIHSHLGMTGVWRIYRRGQKRRHSPASVRIRLRTTDVDAVCTNAPIVELLDAEAVDRHPRLRRLGPDLTAPDPDVDGVLERMQHTDPGRTVGEVLLDQRIAAGIGNVYRSEVCFIEGIDPRTVFDAIDDATRRALVTLAAELLAANVGRIRTTVPNAPPGSLWVYERTGRPCRRCGTPIEAAMIADPPRPAYWCPTCQSAGHQ